MPRRPARTLAERRWPARVRQHDGRLSGLAGRDQAPRRRRAVSSRVRLSSWRKMRIATRLLLVPRHRWPKPPGPSRHERRCRSAAPQRGDRRRRSGRTGGGGRPGRFGLPRRAVRSAAHAGWPGRVVSRSGHRRDWSIIASTSAWAAAPTWPTFAAAPASPNSFAAIASCVSSGPTVASYRLQAAAWLPAPLHLAPSFLRLGYLSLDRAAAASPARCGKLMRMRVVDDPRGPTIGQWLG